MAERCEAGFDLDAELLGERTFRDQGLQLGEVLEAAGADDGGRDSGGEGGEANGELGGGKAEVVEAEGGLAGPVGLGGRVVGMRGGGVPGRVREGALGDDAETEDDVAE